MPLLHRTDRMTAAVNNLTEQAEFQRKLPGAAAALRHGGRKIQTGGRTRTAMSNSGITGSSGRWNRPVVAWQPGLCTVEEYRAFLGKPFDQLNSGRKARLAEEMELLRPLPDRRLESAKRVRARVNSGSLIVVGRNSYSVNSRLIGEIVEARVFSDHLEVWYGGQKVDQFPGCMAAPTTASITATSSTGWCASPALSPTTATASTCSRPVGSGWPMTC